MEEVSIKKRHLKLLKFKINHENNFDELLLKLGVILQTDEGTEYADILICYLLDYFNEFDEEYHQLKQVPIKLEEAILWLREYNSVIDTENGVGEDEE